MGKWARRSPRLAGALARNLISFKTYNSFFTDLKSLLSFYRFENEGSERKTCPRSQSWKMAELGFKLESVSLQRPSSFQASTISLGWDSEDLDVVAEETL